MCVSKGLLELSHCAAGASQVQQEGNDPPQVSSAALPVHQHARCCHLPTRCCAGCVLRPSSSALTAPMQLSSLCALCFPAMPPLLGWLLPDQHCVRIDSGSLLSADTRPALPACRVQDLPHQDNHCDCGLFVLAYLHFFTAYPPSDVDGDKKDPKAAISEFARTVHLRAGSQIGCWPAQVACLAIHGAP